MKRLLTFSALLVLASHSDAQQQYLLQPADSPGVVVIHESDLMQKISAQKIKLNRIQRGIDGYRIEIYQGSDRKQAQEILDAFRELYPDVTADMVFESPYVKVKVGAYRNKLEAQKLYAELKEGDYEYEGVKIVFVKGMKYPTINCDEGKEEE